jgi:hypothetical protein
MRVDELRRDLRSARDDQLAADGVAGRHGVDRYVRRARAQRTGLAVVLVLVLVSAGVFLATRGTDEQRVISGPGDVPHYLPDPMPDGLTQLDEYPIPQSVDPSQRVAVEAVALTNESSDYPTADSSLLVLTVITSPTVGAPSAPQISIGGETSNAYWTDGERTFELLGRGIPEEDFRAAALSAGVDENGRAHLAAPSGYREVAREHYPGASGVSGVVGPLVGNSGYVIRFDQDKPSQDSAYVGGRSLVVAAWPRSHAWMLMSKPLEPTDVRGHPGYLVRITGASQSASSGGSVGAAQEVDAGVLLIWWERDDLMMSVFGNNESDARGFADSLREVDAQEWERFAASVAPLEDNGGSSATFSSSGTASAASSSSIVTVP